MQRARARLCQQRALRRWGAAAAAASCLLVGRGALARCVVPPEAKILWSSPAADAVDVAVDADLLLIGNGGLRQVTLSAGAGTETLLEDEALPGHFALDELEPDADYTVTVRLAFLAGAAGEPEPIRFGFTTGQRRLPTESGALYIAASTEAPLQEPIDPPGLCTEILFANSCLDTGQPVLQAFTMASERDGFDPSSLWLIETSPPSQPSFFRPWPVQCGMPKQYYYSLEDASYRVYNVGPSGSVRSSDSEPGPSSAPAEPPGAGIDSDAGCRLSPRRGESQSLGHLAAGLGLLLAALRRRRAQPTR